LKKKDREVTKTPGPKEFKKKVGVKKEKTGRQNGYSRTTGTPGQGKEGLGKKKN